MADDPIRVRLPEGNFANFPAGTSPEEISKALGLGGPTAPAQPDQYGVTDPGVAATMQPPPGAFPAPVANPNIDQYGVTDPAAAVVMQPPPGPTAPPVDPRSGANLFTDWNTAPDWAKRAGTFLTNFSQGGLSNFGDEAAAAVRATLPTFSNFMNQRSAAEQANAAPRTPDESSIPASAPSAPPVSTAPDWNTRYTEELAKIRAGLGAASQAYPTEATAGNVAGNVAQTVVLPVGKATGAVEGVIPKALVGGGEGAVIGGTAGFGQGTGGVENRLEAAKMPALLGAAFGAGGTIAAPYVGAAANAVAQRTVVPASERAGQILSNMADTPLGQRVAQAWQQTSQLPESFRGTGLPAGVVADPLAGTTAVEREAAQRIAQGLQTGERYGNVDNPATSVRVATALDEHGPSATLAGVDPNLARIARDAYVQPGEAPAIIDEALKANRAAQGGTMREAIGPAPPVEQTQTALNLWQQAHGDQVYNTALRQTPLVESDAMKGLTANNQYVQQAREAVTTAAQKANQTLTPAEVAHGVKAQLNAMAENATGAEAGHMRNSAQQYEQALWAANPHIQAADLSYAQAGGAGRRYGEGLDWMRRGLSGEAQSFQPEVLAGRTAQMTPMEEVAQRAAARAAMIEQTTGAKQTRALADALINSDPQLGLQARLRVIDPEQAPAVMRAAEGVKAAQETERRVVGGSPERAGDIGAAQPKLSGVADPRDWTARVLDWLSEKAGKITQPGAAVRAELARRLITSDPQSQVNTLAMARALLNTQGAPGLSALAPGAGAGVGTQYINPQTLPRR